MVCEPTGRSIFLVFAVQNILLSVFQPKYNWEFSSIWSFSCHWLFLNNRGISSLSRFYFSFEKKINFILSNLVWYIYDFIQQKIKKEEKLIISRGGVSDGLECIENKYF